MSNLEGLPASSPETGADPKPPYPPDMEAAFLAWQHTRDPQAAYNLLQEYHGRAVWQIKDTLRRSPPRSQTLDADDLWQICGLRVLNAARNPDFRPQAGFAFLLNTLRAVQSLGQPVRIAQTAYTMLEKMQEEDDIRFHAQKPPQTLVEVSELLEKPIGDSFILVKPDNTEGVTAKHVVFAAALLDMRSDTVIDYTPEGEKIINPVYPNVEDTHHATLLDTYVSPVPVEEQVIDRLYLQQLMDRTFKLKDTPPQFLEGLSEKQQSYNAVTKKMRTAIGMRYGVEGHAEYSAQEIARFLGCTQRSVNHLLKHGRELLRAQVEASQESTKKPE